MNITMAGRCSHWTLQTVLGQCRATTLQLHQLKQYTQFTSLKLKLLASHQHSQLTSAKYYSSLINQIKDHARRRPQFGVTLAASTCYMSIQTDPKNDFSNKQKDKSKNDLLNKFKNIPPEVPQFGVDDAVEKKRSLKSQLSNRVYTLPNLLCAFRIGITPVIGYLIVAGDYDYALALCAISSVTDFLDGWIARTFDSESKLGAVLDPLADKLLVATLTFALTYVHLIPLWLTALILTRDLLIILGGVYMQYHYVKPPRTLQKFVQMDTFKSDRFRPTLISKVNTGFQLSLVLMSLASPLFPHIFTANPWFLQSLQVSTGLTTLFSGLNYLRRLK